MKRAMPGRMTRAVPWGMNLITVKGLQKGHISVFWKVKCGSLIHIIQFLA
jgi:hypothetical protein